MCLYFDDLDELDEDTYDSDFVSGNHFESLVFGFDSFD